MLTYPLVVLVQSPYHVVFIGTDPVEIRDKNLVVGSSIMARTPTKISLK